MNHKIIEMLNLKGVARQLMANCSLIDVRVAPDGKTTYNLVMDQRAEALKTPRILRQIEAAMTRQTGVVTHLRIIATQHEPDRAPLSVALH